MDLSDLTILSIDDLVAASSDAAAFAAFVPAGGERRPYGLSAAGLSEGEAVKVGDAVSDTTPLWNAYDRLPEIHTAGQIHQSEVASAVVQIGWRTDVLSPPKTLEDWEAEGEPKEVPKQLEDLLAKIAVIAGDGIGETIAQIALQRWISGRSYLACYDPADLKNSEWDTSTRTLDDDRIREILTSDTSIWEVLSDYECSRTKTSAGKAIWKIRGAGKDNADAFLGAGDVVIVDMRRRHPKSRVVGDTALRPLQGDCDALLALMRTVRVVAASQTIAGVMLLPREVDAVAQTTAAKGERVPAVLQRFTDAMSSALQDEKSGGAFIPLVLTGSAEAVAAAKWLDLRRSFDQALVALMELYAKRIATGLDQQTDELSGTGDTNHWSAAEARTRQLDRWSGRDAQQITGLITRGVIGPFLRAVGLADQAGHWTLMVDKSSIDESRRDWLVVQLATAGIMRPDAALQILGFDPADAPSVQAVAGSDVSTAQAPTTTPEQQQQLSVVANAAQILLGERLAADLADLTAEDVRDLVPSRVASDAVSVLPDEDRQQALAEMQTWVEHKALEVFSQTAEGELAAALAREYAAVWSGQFR